LCRFLGPEHTQSATTKQQRDKTDLISGVAREFPEPNGSFVVFSALIKSDIDGTGLHKQRNNCDWSGSGVDEDTEMPTSGVLGQKHMRYRLSRPEDRMAKRYCFISFNLQTAQRGYWEI
jgi:hypothetical protein